ncbi:MAG: DUF5103 domain-containing protein [Dysgonomonas sp.]
MKYWIFFLLLPFSVIANAQVYQTEPLSDEIHTIQVLKNGDWQQSPVIEINSGDYIQLGFDRISEDSFNRLRYKIIHCNADWTQSSLSEIEYLDGFNDNLIEDYAASMNTTVEYTNFRLIIPNQDILRFKASGNYAVLVYEEDNRDNVMLSARFSVVDPQIVIAGNMSSNTLIDSNKSHQQISFILNHKGLNINDPYSDLKIFVRQNERQDNQKTDVKPTFIQPSRLVYEQNRDLIFPAGNEYRRFDMPSSRYNGLRIYHMEYNRPFLQRLRSTR